MEQTIRFCTAPDGVRLAYAEAGEGPPLVKAANWLNHLEFDWRSPVWHHLLTGLASRFRLLRYDERGNGLSDWDVESFSFEAMVQDLEAVVDAAGLERFALFGISQGCPVSVAYAVRHPERVTRLVLHGGYARGWKKRGNAAEIERSEALFTLIRQGWGSDNPAFRQVFTSLFVPGGTLEQMEWFNELQRMTTSPDNAIRLLEAVGEIDVSDLLPQVRAPTLVLHCRDDARAPFQQGLELAGGIPEARFVPLESPNHVVLEHESIWPRFKREIVSFLSDEAPTMSSLEWAEVDRQLDRLLDLPDERRGPWLDEHCADRPELRARLERLLQGIDDEDSLRTAGALQHDLLTPADRDALLAPGRRLGGYEIVEHVGSGGMGLVYRARHERLGRDVAIKALPACLAADPEARARFDREARLLARLDHPNIATVHDFFIVGELPYLVLEFVRGETLSARLARDAMTVDEIYATARQLVAALAEAHGKGIAHRDLKPSNIKFTERGVVKVLDFGLAKVIGTEHLAADGETFTTRAHLALGTPGYMSPEQARGADVDVRSDVWSLGCVLYEMLCRRRAFAGASSSDALAALLRDEPDWSALPADTPSPVADMIRRCLEKDPTRRPRRVEEIRPVLDV